MPDATAIALTALAAEPDLRRQAVAEEILQPLTEAVGVLAGQTLGPGGVALLDAADDLVVLDAGALEVLAEIAGMEMIEADPVETHAVIQQADEGSLDMRVVRR